MSKKATSAVTSGVKSEKFKSESLPDAPKKQIGAINKANDPKARGKAPGASRL